NENQAVGAHQIQWNGTDQSGRQLASGIYFCRIQAGKIYQTVKLVLLR
ncbi:MAG: hypothetical protein K9M19_05265, partial [Candidatus Marinimicrobia bacterium]|nr:hypothetical protein [Candidatus Neomarinimicrobiota bacterium]